MPTSWLWKANAFVDAFRVPSLCKVGRLDQDSGTAAGSRLSAVKRVKSKAALMR